MKSPGRRALLDEIQNRYRLLWDSSKQGPAGRFAKPFPVRSKPPKRKRGWLDAGGNGVRMTRRMVRYGGMKGIETLRSDQLGRLGELIGSDETSEEIRDLAKSALEFLNGNRLRVLNIAPWSFEPDAVETWAEAFGWNEGTP